MNYLAQLRIPGHGEIERPGNIPQGGIAELGGGLGGIVGVVFVIAISVATILLVLGGIQWILSGGDKQKIATARNRITFALLGLVLMLLSFAIVSILGYFFNLKLI